MKKYLVKIETYLTSIRTIATCETMEEAEKVLAAYHFKYVPNRPRECEVSGWIEETCE